MGIPVDVGTRHEILAELSSWATQRFARPRTAFDLYANCFNEALRNAEYRAALLSSDLNYPDGMGVVLALRAKGVRRGDVQKATTTDLIHPLCELFAEKGVRLFILGARPGVAQIAGDRLQGIHRRLNVVGIHDGYFAENESSHVVDAVNSAKTQVLMVCMGVPKEQVWTIKHLGELHVSLVMTAGGLLDFVSGNTRRGPKWMTDHGLEWLFRLGMEPRRLARRYLIGNTQFGLLLLRHLIRQRLIK